MNNKTLTKLKNDKDFNNTIKDLVENSTTQQMKSYMQHYNTTCFDHCYLASYYCYKISKRFNWDYKSAARGAMLHDLFLYDWRKRQNGRKGLHAYTHGQTAYDNATKLFDLNKKEKDMIKNHMFPVTIIPPKSKEGLLLTLVDKYCCIKDAVDYYSNKIKK